jgi:hypothetical protein
MPVSDPLQLLVGYVGGQLRHRVDAEVATVRHHRGQHGTNVLGRRLLAPRGREEITGKAKLIVNFDQEVRQFHVAHVLCQPGFEVSQTILFLLVQFLGGLGGQAPAVLVSHGVAIARGCPEKALIGFAETARKILRYLLGIGGQTRTVKKSSRMLCQRRSSMKNSSSRANRLL